MEKNKIEAVVIDLFLTLENNTQPEIEKHLKQKGLEIKIGKVSSIINKYLNTKKPLL